MAGVETIPDVDVSKQETCSTNYDDVTAKFVKAVLRKSIRFIRDELEPLRVLDVFVEENIFGALTPSFVRDLREQPTTTAKNRGILEAVSNRPTIYVKFKSALFRTNQVGLLDKLKTIEREVHPKDKNNVPDRTLSTNQNSGIQSIMLSAGEAPPDFGVVAAIDFGTSRSGFAFGFRKKGSAEINLADIQLNKWQLRSASSSVDKAPTTLLLTPDRIFHSFGFKAEEAFAQLADTKREKGWWYFARFKMELYKNKLSRDLKLHDAEGKAIPASVVFSVVIGHMKTCILAQVKDQIPSIRDDDVLYVLTVPAIWSDAAKQFMREAATAQQVGIKEKQLQLVLEPEAASVFCRTRDARVVRDSGTTSFEALEVGHPYIIIDLGGGTADMATHKIIENEQLQEIDYARGDDSGGQLFNESFITFLCELFGEFLFQQWASSQHDDYLRLLRDIEVFKTMVSESTEDIVLVIPQTLVKDIESKKIRYHVFRTRKDSIEKKVSQSRFSANVEVTSPSKLLIKNGFVRKMFDKIINGVVKHVKDISTHSVNIETVFLVGGLAQSRYVRHAVKKEFPEYTFIVPEDPGVAVLKGAVLLGNKPQSIACRIAKYTYGIGVTRAFEEGTHDERHKFTRDDAVWCGNIFKKLITKGQALKYGDVFATKTHLDAKLPETKQKTFTTELFQSSSENPVYTTDTGCTNLGGIVEYPPEDGWPDYTESQVKIIVGEAEFRFYIKDELDREYETTVDFLSQRNVKKTKSYIPYRQLSV